ncbi:MAG TPA: Dabb family protein [Phycisphaerales bacterium]|nr:Dabb family protein [Phycisphaerales bacterium]
MPGAHHTARTTRRLGRFAAAALALALLGSVPGCACPPHGRAAPTGAPSAPARINHIVLFTLRDPADADALIADARESLAPIPSVVSIFCGKHLDAGRSGVMTDYHACVYVGFDSPDGYSEYVAHPRHQQLVARWKDRLAGYRVYDVLDPSAQ